MHLICVIFTLAGIGIIGISVCRCGGACRHHGSAGLLSKQLRNPRLIVDPRSFPPSNVLLAFQMGTQDRLITRHFVGFETLHGRIAAMNDYPRPPRAPEANCSIRSNRRAGKARSVCRRARSRRPGPRPGSGSGIRRPAPRCWPACSPSSSPGSNKSPGRVRIPSLKDSVPVPKKCTWMSPGRRNCGYLK